MSKTAQKPASPPVRDFQPDPPARLIGLLLALLTVLVYLPVGSHGYVFFDDPSYVADNPMVQNGLTWTGFKWAFAGWHAGNWHPLTWLSHELDCQLFGVNPGAHHLVNVLFHAANAVLLFRLWLRLTQACWPSALVAALFAWHPLHVESVAWVAERKDVLSTFFGLLALLAYARYAGKSEARSPKAGTFYGASLAAFALALLAKPMLVTLPFVMLLLDYWPLRRRPGASPAPAWRRVREKWPFFLLTALSCGITFLAQRREAVLTLGQYPLGLRLENAVVAAAGYLTQTLWPVNLCVFYPRPTAISAASVALAAAVLAAVSVWVWRARGRHGYLLTGWLWFLGMLVPVIGLVQVGDQAMADRYTYLPATGLFVMAAFGLAEIRTRWKIPMPALNLAAVLILGACVAVTERQLTFWRDTETLFTRALAVTTRNGPAHMMLGVALERSGRSAAAMDEYQRALAVNPALMVQVAGGEKRPLAAQVELLRGQAAESAGGAADARAHYQAALRLDAGLVEAHNNLGNLLDRQGHPDEALEQYAAAVRLRPGTPVTHENLGIQLAEMGRWDEARREYQAAAQLAPDDPRPIYLLGKAWLRNGDDARAETAFQQALALDPEDSPSLVYLARLLASAASPQLRDGTRAVTLAEKANTITGGNQPLVLGTLAMAYAEAGRLADARQTVQAALNLATNRSPETVAELRTQLQLYEAGRPFRTGSIPPSPPHP